MAKSTAEKLAQELPEQKNANKENLGSLLWKRNAGYLNRKATSILLDLIEILSIALLADTQSLKNFYAIWIIFYFAQGTLESLFYSARKQFVFNKEHPSKRILIYIHVLTMIVPTFFLVYGFERFSKNDFIFGYLAYKSMSFLLSITFSLLNFKAQAFSRVYYPPKLNWYIILSVGIAQSIIHYIFSSYISFYLIIGTVLIAKTFQEVTSYKMGTSLKESILWNLKQSRIKTSNSVKEFIILLLIELFLPMAVFLTEEKRFYFKDIFYISILYMTVKVCLRPFRSMILEFKRIGTKNRRNLFLLSYILIITLLALLFFTNAAPGKIICISFIHFNFLFIWNFNYSNEKKILFFLLLSLILIYSLDKGPYLVSFAHLIWVSRVYLLAFSTPANLLKASAILQSKDLFLITFKQKANWKSLANKYPEMRWAPLGKKRCLVDSSMNQSGMHKLIELKSYDIQSFEALSGEGIKRLKKL